MLFRLVASSAAPTKLANIDASAFETGGSAKPCLHYFVMEAFGLVIVAGFTGLVNIGAGILVRKLARRAADGDLGRNGYAGIRTKSTLASDEAWLAGHKAALAWSLRSGLMFSISGAVCMVLAVASALASMAVILVGAGLGLLALILATRDANHAAQSIS